jgi:hypothetical protein
MSRPRDRSLQEAMRARRQAKPLLTVEELRKREAERAQTALESEAARLVELWRREGTPVDAAGNLEPPLYRAIFALGSGAYHAGRHWARRVKAQLSASPACEVERCGEATELRVHRLSRRAVGEERVGVDLITLCEGCLRRADRRRRSADRALTRAELVQLDPARPLYDRKTIAALKTKYARPLRRADLGG